MSRSVSLDDLGVDGDDLTWGSFTVGAGTALDAEGDPASRPHVARVSVDDLGVEGGGGGGGGSLGPEDIALELGDVEVGGGDGELRRSFAFSRSSSRGSLSSPRPSSARLVCTEPHLPVRGDSAAMLAVARAEGGAAPQRARGAAPPEPRTPLRRRPSAEEVDAALEVLAAAAEDGTLREGALSVEARPAIPRLAEVTRAAALVRPRRRCLACWGLARAVGVDAPPRCRSDPQPRPRRGRRAGGLWRQLGARAKLRHHARGLDRRSVGAAWLA